MQRRMSSAAQNVNVVMTSPYWNRFHDANELKIPLAVRPGNALTLPLPIRACGWENDRR